MQHYIEQQSPMMKALVFRVGYSH